MFKHIALMAILLAGTAIYAEPPRQYPVVEKQKITREYLLKLSLISELTLGEEFRVVEAGKDPWELRKTFASIVMCRALNLSKSRDELSDLAKKLTPESRREYIRVVGKPPEEVVKDMNEALDAMEVGFAQLQIIIR